MIYAALVKRVISSGVERMALGYPNQCHYASLEYPISFNCELGIYGA